MREKNREKVRQYQRDYYIQNKEKFKEYWEHYWNRKADEVYSAAKYLAANGVAKGDLRKAVYAYNHGEEPTKRGYVCFPCFVGGSLLV